MSHQNSEATNMLSALNLLTHAAHDKRSRVDFFPSAIWKSGTKVLFIWRNVVPGRRVTLPPEPSFTELRLYEKSCSCWPSQNLALSASRMLFMSRLVPGRRGKNSQSVYMVRPQGDPTFKASNPPPRVTLHPGTCKPGSYPAQRRKLISLQICIHQLLG